MVAVMVAMGPLGISPAMADSLEWAGNRQDSGRQLYAGAIRKSWMVCTLPQPPEERPQSHSKAYQRDAVRR